MAKSQKMTKACQRCRLAKKRCVFSSQSPRCDRCDSFNLSCTRVSSNQGARSDICQNLTHTDIELSRDTNQHETHFCSQAADESRFSSLDSSLADSVSFGSDVDSCFNSSLNKAHMHSSHEGVDMSFLNECEMEFTNCVLPKKVNCSGVRKVFEVINGPDLKESEVSTRFEMDYDGNTTFIQCTSLFFNRLNLSGSLLVFRMKEVSTWRLGMISSYNYNLDSKSEDVVTLYEWTGEVSATGSPLMFACNTWEELSVHLKLKTVRIDDVRGYFVNQVCIIPVRLLYNFVMQRLKNF